MAVNGINGVSATVDGCDLEINGHHLSGNGPPAFSPVDTTKVWLYTDLEASDLYNWNPSAGRWNTEYTQIWNVREFNPAADGVTDDTAVFQAAVDAMPLGTGGILYIPPGTYAVRSIDLRKSVTVIGAGVARTVLKKTGGAGVAERGVFTIVNQIGRQFRFRGIDFDLNGEGPMEIGIAGRILNEYLSVPIVGITGPANAAIYAEGSENNKVEDVRIGNTGETALLFRNCANIDIDRCEFFNIAGIGVEFSVPDLGSPHPVRERYKVRNCQFRDIIDYRLGQGNAVGISIVGNGDDVFRSVDFSHNYFYHVDRCIQSELSTVGATIANFDISHNQMERPLQGGIALIRARDGVVSENTIIDAGAAPTGALNTGYPELYGAILSAEWDNIEVHNNRVIDRRGWLNVLEAGAGDIAAGSAILDITGGNVTANYVGAWVGISGAGPLGTVVHMAQITVVNSPTQVTLDRPAVTSVTGADVAYGGATRRPMTFRGGTGALVHDNIIRGGVHSGLPVEPDAAAMYILVTSEYLPIHDNILIAPNVTGATTPAGIKLANPTPAAMPMRDNVFVGDFDERYDGFEIYNTDKDHFRAHVVQLEPIFPDAAAGIEGVPLAIVPRGSYFDIITDINAETDTMAPGEQVTLRVRFVYHGGSDENISQTFGSPTNWDMTIQGMSVLHRDNQPIKAVEFYLQSNQAGSGARARCSLVAYEH